MDVLCVHFVRREISHVRLCLTVITQWGGVVQWCHAMSRLSSRLAETSQKYLTWKQLTFNIISYSCSVSTPTCNTWTVQQHSEWILTKHINFLHQWPINIYIASLDLPDEGFTMNWTWKLVCCRKNAPHSHQIHSLMSFVKSKYGWHE